MYYSSNSNVEVLQRKVKEIATAKVKKTAIKRWRYNHLFKNNKSSIVTTSAQ